MFTKLVRRRSRLGTGGVLTLLSLMVRIAKSTQSFIFTSVALAKPNALEHTSDAACQLPDDVHERVHKL